MQLFVYQDAPPNFSFPWQPITPYRFGSVTSIDPEALRRIYEYVVLLCSVLSFEVSSLFLIIFFGHFMLVSCNM